MKRSIEEANRKQFEALRKLSLPMGHYLISGSGALGIRNLREMSDIDLLVSESLWQELAKKYGTRAIEWNCAGPEKGVFQKIVFPGGRVEAFGASSFALDATMPSIEEKIRDAELIDGLPFDSLETILFYKRKQRRAKDLSDILLIEAWLNSQKRADC